MSRKITSFKSLKKLTLGEEINEFLTNFLKGKSSGSVSSLRKDVIVQWIRPEFDNLGVTSTMLYYPTPYNSNREDDYLIEIGRKIGISRRFEDFYNVPQVYHIQTIANLRSNIRHPLINEITEKSIFENTEEQIIAEQIIKSVNKNFRFQIIKCNSVEESNRIILCERYFSNIKNSKSIERRVNNILKARFLVEDFFRKYDEEIIQRAKEKAKKYLKNSQIQ